MSPEILCCLLHCLLIREPDRKLRDRIASVSPPEDGLECLILLLRAGETVVSDEDLYHRSRLLNRIALRRASLLRGSTTMVSPPVLCGYTIIPTYFRTSECFTQRVGISPVRSKITTTRRVGISSPQISQRYATKNQAFTSRRMGRSGHRRAELLWTACEDGEGPSRDRRTGCTDDRSRDLLLERSDSEELSEIRSLA